MNANIKNQSQYDKMTKTSVEKLIVTLSIPTILSMMVSNVYNLYGDFRHNNIYSGSRIYTAFP